MENFLIVEKFQAVESLATFLFNWESRLCEFIAMIKNKLRKTF